MNTIILAAGRNQRLHPQVPPFHKPLIKIKGNVPLIKYLVNIAATIVQSQRIIIVAAPQNIGDIWAEVRDVDRARDIIRIVVQPGLYGPGDALMRGLEVSDTMQTLVLMGDNVMSEMDVASAMYEASKHAREDSIIGVQGKKLPEATRFSLIREDKQKIVEGNDWRLVESMETSIFSAWCGPIIVPSTKMHSVLEECRPAWGSLELPIGTLIPRAGRFYTVRTPSVRDIGTLEALEEYTQEDD